MTRTNLIAFIIIAVGCLTIGFFIGRGKHPTKETITVKEIQVVRDTVEARMFADQSDVLRKRINELENLKPQIKYVNIYKELPHLTVPEIDSAFDSAVRFDN